MNWEYRLELFGAEAVHLLQKELNRNWGAHGWEVISVKNEGIGYLIVAKRPKKEAITTEGHTTSPTQAEGQRQTPHHPAQYGSMEDQSE